VTANVPLPFDQVDANDFEVTCLDDEIRADALCGRLLLAIRDALLADGHPPLAAGELCRGADLFLRDFVIAACGDNPLRLLPERVRQFAGHWYIVNTLEPNAAELAIILDGITACYAVLAARSLVGRPLAEAVARECADRAWYRQRIEDYWDVIADGFGPWRAACPLPKRRI
jgi:hypothetical protein